MIDVAEMHNDILLYSPWLTRVLLSLPIEPDISCPTAGTDGRHIVYNDIWFEGLQRSERLAVIVHECLHVLLGHHLRRGDRDARRWNVAADYEINPYVLEAGYTLPADALLPPSGFVDKEAEYIYPRLPAVPASQWDFVTDNGEMRTVERREADTQAWKELVAVTKVGDLPGSIARALGERIVPRRTVADAVAIYLATALDDTEETWAPCSRRWRYLPSRLERPAGHIAVAVDTSGSMDNAELSRCLSEVLGIAAIGRVDLIYADAAVQGVYEDVHSASIPMPHGGGGTDFRPALAEIAKRGADIAVYLTDGEGTYGPPQPGIVWASPVRPPWGDWIDLTNLKGSQS